MCRLQRHFQHAGEAEIGQIGVTLFIQQDVIRLDITVNDALAVRIIERGRDLFEDALKLEIRQRAALEQIAERAAPHIAQDEKGAAIRSDIEVIEGDNVRVFEPGNNLRFPFKAGDSPPGVLIQIQSQNFKHNRPVVRSLTRLIDLGETALPDLRADLEIGEFDSAHHCPSGLILASVTDELAGAET